MNDCVVVEDTNGLALFSAETNTNVRFSTYSLANAGITFVNEIPAGTSVKNELFTDLDNVERIKAQLIGEEPRMILPPPSNYGFITKTKSDRGRIDPWIGLPGDGDCLDAFLVSYQPLATGELIAAKPIAALQCEDSGEADWKIILVHNSSSTVDPLPLVKKITGWLLSYKPNMLKIQRVVYEPAEIQEIINYHSIGL